MEGVAGGGISMERTTASDVRRKGGVIGDGRRSCERMNPWREKSVLVFWDGYGGRPRGWIIPCRSAMGGVGGQGRRWNLPHREV